MSVAGTSRHFVATQQFSRFRSEADIQRAALTEPPEPVVLFMGFGDSALEFELRGMLEDVNRRLSTLNDLRFDIFRRFRAAGIEIPFPQRDIHIRPAPGTDAGTPPASAM
jgi:small-conductance mechanosensitive channel